MPPKKNTASEWARYDDEIVRKYVDEKNTLEQVREYMKSKYNFDKEIGSYKKRYAGSKNIKKREWVEIVEVVEKRRRLGKESQVYHNGRLVENAKLERKKAWIDRETRKGKIGRDASSPVMSPGPSDRIVVRTPRPRCATPASIAPSVTNMNAGAAIEYGVSNPYYPLGDAVQGIVDFDHDGFFMATELESFFPGTSDYAERRLSPALMQPGWRESFLGDAPWLIDVGSGHDGPTMPVLSYEDSQAIPTISRNGNMRNSMRLPFLQLLQNRDLTSIRYTPTGVSNTCFFRLTTHAELGTDGQLGVPTSSDRAGSHNVLQAVWGHSSSPNRNTISSLISYLAPQVPEAAEGDLAKTVKALFEPSEKHPLQCIFEVTAFLSSNDKLTVTQMQTFLEWIFDGNHMASLESFLMINNATTRAFSQHLVKAAVQLGKVGLLRSMLHAGVDFRLAMKEAIVMKDYDFVELLLSRTDKATLSGESGGQLLYALASSNNTKAAEILIDNGTDVRFECEDEPYESTTSLHKAVMASSLVMTKFLLGKGANVNCVDSEGDTPLARAVFCVTNDFLDIKEDVKRTYKEIINVLLEYDASTQCSVGKEDLIDYVSVRDPSLCRLLREKTDGTSSGITVADILDAASNGSAALSKLIERHEQRVTSKKWETALYQLVLREYGDLEALPALLAVGVDPNTPSLDRKPLTSTQYWSEAGAEAVSRLLIKAGADVNVPGLLSGAASRGGLRLLQTYLDAGADLGRFGPKALVGAIRAKRIEAVALLIDRGVDLRAFGNDMTPLQAAASLETLGFAEYLLGRGKEQGINASELVNAPAWDYHGRTALQFACKSGCIEMVAWLLSHGAEVSAPPAADGGITPLEAIMQNHSRPAEKEDLFKMLLDKGMEVTKSYGQELGGVLNAVIRDGQTKLLDLLLEAKIDVNQRPDIHEGRTPLQLAAELGRLDMAQKLFRHGADINARPGYRFGRSALQAATTASSPNMELVKFLVENGADINAAPSEFGGVTAIQGAAIAGNIPVLEFLISNGGRVHGRTAFHEGRTALEGAAEHGRLDTVNFLLYIQKEEGSIQGSEIQRAIDLARKNHHVEVVNVLGAASR